MIEQGSYLNEGNLSNILNGTFEPIGINGMDKFTGFDEMPLR